MNRGQLTRFRQVGPGQIMLAEAAGGLSLGYWQVKQLCKR